MTLNESDKNVEQKNLFDEKFKYKINDTGDGVIITKYVGTDENVVIPTMINELPVIGMGYEAFEDCKNLTSIKIPESVTYIEERAF